MAKKLFVGNISWKMTDDELQDLFAEFGEIIDFVILKERDTGRSRGFGFVEFAEDADAEAAIDDMNEKEILGRPLIVNEARPRD